MKEDIVRNVNASKLFKNGVEKSAIVVVSDYMAPNEPHHCKKNILLYQASGKGSERIVLSYDALVAIKAWLDSSD